MSAVNSMYQYSLASYLQVFDLSLRKSLPDSILPKRLKNIMDTLTMNVYNYACTGKDKTLKQFSMICESDCTLCKSVDNGWCERDTVGLSLYRTCYLCRRWHRTLAKKTGSTTECACSRARICVSYQPISGINSKILHLKQIACLFNYIRIRPPFISISY